MLNYRDKIFNNYYTTTIKEDETAKIRLKYFKKNYISHLPLDKNAKILDIGPGRGEFLFMLRDLGYKNSEGADISPEIVQYCNNKIGLGNVILIKDLVQFLAERQGQYDTIVMFEIIEHFTKEEACDILCAANNALKPGGKLIVETINAANLFAPFLNSGDFTHEWAYTQRNLSQLLIACGFRETRAFPVKVPIYSVARFIQVCLQYIWRPFVRFLLLVESIPGPRNIIAPSFYVVAFK
jgi:2-polyprenyl-3-methyl-5-hydroxy-6-metoxy-1,4-benzoquinol methylase